MRRRKPRRNANSMNKLKCIMKRTTKATLKIVYFSSDYCVNGMNTVEREEAQPPPPLP